MNRHVERPFETFRTYSLLARLQLALRSWLEFWQTDWTGVQSGGQVMTVSLMVHMRSLLSLELFALHDFVVVTKMRGHTRVDVVLACILVFYQPWRTIPCITSDRLLNEGPEHRLGEDTAISADMLIRYICLFVRVFEIHQVAGCGQRMASIRKSARAECCLVANQSMSAIASLHGHCDLFTRVVVMLELIVDLIDEVIEA
jgi:hypothetical protein